MVIGFYRMSDDNDFIINFINEFDVDRNLVVFWIRNEDEIEDDENF